jgi:hypothetical protein
LITPHAVSPKNVQVQNILTEIAVTSTLRRPALQTGDRADLPGRRHEMRPVHGEAARPFAQDGTARRRSPTGERRTPVVALERGPPELKEETEDDYALLV